MKEIDRRGASTSLMIGYSATIGLLLACNIMFNKYHFEDGVTIVSVADLIDLFTPYVLIVFYWQMYIKGLHLAGRDVSGDFFRSTFCFLIVALIWCQGHALHNSANSISNAFSASGLHPRSHPHEQVPLPVLSHLGQSKTVAHVADWYDEVFSHVLWVFGLIALEWFGIHYHLMEPKHPSDTPLSLINRISLALSSLLYSANFWGTCVEGGNSLMGLLFSCYVVYRIYKTPQLWSLPLIFYFFCTAVTTLLLFIVYAVYWRQFLFSHHRLPEFSEISNIFG